MQSYKDVQTENVQYKQTAWVIVAIFVILGILGVLSAVAIPHAGEMLYQSAAEARQTELLHIQNAVAGMLRESPAGALEPVGPTADMSKVHTVDTEQLTLSDYLTEDDTGLATGCRYSFTADGLVIQFAH